VRQPARKGAKWRERWRKWGIVIPRIVSPGHTRLASLVKAKVKVQLGYRCKAVRQVTPYVFWVNARGHKPHYIGLDHRTGKVTPVTWTPVN
jgi:hypothetical protein